MRVIFQKCKKHYKPNISSRPAVWQFWFVDGKVLDNIVSKVGRIDLEVFGAL